MKKTALALALVLTISIVIGVGSINLVEANPTITALAAPDISLDSPLNKTYAGNILLDFTVTASKSWATSYDGYIPYGMVQELNSVDYYVDGSLRGSIVANSNLSSPFHYSASLTDLQEGSHSLMVKTDSTGFMANWVFGVNYGPANSSSATVYFNLTRDIAAATSPPVILIVSPTNQTYKSDVLLHLNLTTVSDNQELNLVSYTLDGQNILVYKDQGEREFKRALNWSAALKGLAEGAHTLKVTVSLKSYFDTPARLTRASYQICSGTSDEITFTVVSSELFTVTIVIAFASALVAFSLGVIVYFKRYKGR
jgi:ABC-type transport system involved in multi-copper enzyme maturation permease subunit